MRRWKLLIEYDGGPFVGWQHQANGNSIQSSIEQAIHSFSGEFVTVQGAGRTDSGVHALGQVAHVDLKKVTNPKTIRDAINFHLKPAPITILSADVVGADFHARFSAKNRTYLYRIIDRRPAPVVEAGRVWHVRRQLNVSNMHKAAQTLIGTYDFTSFRAKGCQAGSPIRTLKRLDVGRMNNEIHIYVQARSFLYHQVRNLTGTLKLVGEGKWTTRDLEVALYARDRSASGPTAPAKGLYLIGVSYGS